MDVYYRPLLTVAHTQKNVLYLSCSIFFFILRLERHGCTNKVKPAAEQIAPRCTYIESHDTRCAGSQRILCDELFRRCEPCFLASRKCAAGFQTGLSYAENRSTHAWKDMVKLCILKLSISGSNKIFRSVGSFVCYCSIRFSKNTNTLPTLVVVIFFRVYCDKWSCIMKIQDPHARLSLSKVQKLRLDELK